jgi:predicted O-linked N-acetylglucosamine transferase (SPINDLY family)
MSPSVAQWLANAQEKFRSGDIVGAEKLLRRVLTQAPANPTANELMGYIAGNRGQLDYSFDLLKTATAAPGASGQAFYYLGKHCLDRALFEDAAAAYRQSLQLTGDFFEGAHDLGVALLGCGKPELALTLFDKALTMRPDFDQAWFNKGVALDQLKRFDDALQCYDKALLLNPGFNAALNNRSATLIDLGRYDEALASNDKAVEREPGNAHAWSNRGVTLFQLKRFEEALDNHARALSLDPEFAEAWARGGCVFAELKQSDKALNYFNKALAIKPDLPVFAGDYLRARMNVCQWDAVSNAMSIEQHFETVVADIGARQTVVAPLTMLAAPATPAQQRHCAEIYCKDRFPAVAAPIWPTHPEERKRIKIGYFSPDFRAHAVTFLTAGLFECHDRARFETHAFAFGPSGIDPMRTRVQSAFEYYHDVCDLPERNIALLAQELHLDIAVDLAGHTGGARTGIFARRAAPIQVNYLGFPGTMGANFIDYIIADDMVVPDGAANDFAEKLVFLPDSFQVNDSKRAIAAVQARAFYGLPADAFVFCSFSSVYKLNPRIFNVWMNILRGTEHSVLWLLGDNEMQMQNLRTWAAKQGVAPHRLIFSDTLAYDEHLARYALADLVLDTLPFNGGTTTSDALWGGAPVLTCVGDTFAGRMSSSLLRAVALEELITHTLDDYQACALRLAHHPNELAYIRKKLSVNARTHTLFDTAVFTRHIEAAYAEMWRRYQSGLPPAHLRIQRVSAAAGQALDTAAAGPGMLTKT